ncbi:hypothetical protein [Bradyrhizobium sp. RDI18]|uniref:hypothetical protein n=1 Tax=Bradyrhizobium sp. RDI18 TaxID=3367400 RepID=UPI00371BC412
MLNPATFDVPVISTVEGASVDGVFRGDPELDAACIAAAERLGERGPVTISASCGLSIRHQAAVAASANVPVALSSLLLLPTLLRQPPPVTKIAVLVADSMCLDDDMVDVDNLEQRARLVIGGIEGERGVVVFARIQAAHPDIAAVPLECTRFPLVAPAIRRMKGSPIYDIMTLCRDGDGGRHPRGMVYLSWWPRGFRFRSSINARQNVWRGFSALA